MHRITDYLTQIQETLDNLPLDEIDRVILILHEARLAGKQIFVMGNGGSASTATHMVCDLSKNTRTDGWPHFKVIGLSDNMAAFSAIANDEGYENVFATQLEALVARGDVVIGISTSGNSPNVLRAIELANQRGATTIGFTGFDGGRLSSLVDVDLHVPSSSIEQVEDIHLMLEHLVTKILREESSRLPAPAQLEWILPNSVTRLNQDMGRETPGIQHVELSSIERSQASQDLFSDVSQDLALELDLRDLLRRVLHLALDNLGGSSGSIVVLNDEGDVLEGALAYHGEVEEHTPQQFTDIVERGLAGWVMQNREAALVKNTQDDPRWLPRVWDQEGEARSAVSVPLIDQGKVVGVLTVVDRQTGKFTQADLSMLSAVAVFITLVNYSGK